MQFSWRLSVLVLDSIKVLDNYERLHSTPGYRSAEQYEHDHPTTRGSATSTREVAVTNRSPLRRPHDSRPQGATAPAGTQTR